MTAKITKKIKTTTYPITVKVWGAADEDGNREARIARVRTKGNMRDLTKAVGRAMQLTPKELATVKWSTHLGTVRALYRSPGGLDRLEAVTEPIPGVCGAAEASCSLEIFLSLFTMADPFTATREELLYHYAIRTARMKREDALLGAFRKLPARQQTLLLKALHVGPAIVLTAAGGSR